MTGLSETRERMLDAWRTNQRVTSFLVENCPLDLWEAKVPEVPRRTVRMLAAHLHNVRCSWTRTLGLEHGVSTPASVDRHRVSPSELVSALGCSSAGIEALLDLGFEHEGTIPLSRLYVWRNLPLNVAHALTYFVAHEAHHRGQIVLIARQAGHRFPPEVTDGLWQWTRRAREASA